jgi:ribosomal subunit interface protein
MDLIFKNRNGKISERQREHIETKLSKLSRYLDQIEDVEVEISTEQRQDEGEVHRMQVTLVGERGVILRADRSARDLYVATDMVQDVLQRQIKRYKEKHWRRGKLRRKDSEFVMPELMSELAMEEAAAEAEPPRHMVRVKEFALRPMFSDEAVEQMELLDHTFFVFRDADTSRVSVVYRRNDGNYGMIIPVED